VNSMSKALRLIFIFFLLDFFSFIAQEGFPVGPNSDRGQSQQLEIGQEEKEANRLQPPDRIMDAIGVKPGMVIGEVGAGRGRFTVHLATRVGGEGKVYANDIDADALAFLRDRSVRQARAQTDSSVLTRREATRIDVPNSPGLQTLTGPYFGQKPPGMTPEIFAPGIVSKEGDQGELNISPDLSEIIYWERKPPDNLHTIVRIVRDKGRWKAPEIFLFSRDYINNEPSLSPDGKKLFFVSNRPKSANGAPEQTPDIWFVEKAEGKWGEPMNMGAPVNTDGVEVQPFMSAEPSFYFCKPPAEIYCSKLSAGQWQEPVKLSQKINRGRVSSPRVSPDTTYLVFHSNNPGGFGSYDLYISFKDPSGDWMESKNMGPIINTAHDEGDATFSPDGKFIFFSRDGDIYWVAAKIIEELRPKHHE